MGNSVYSINKAINKPIEFKGLKAQYIWYLGIGLVVLLLLFTILYIAGVNAFICLGVVGLLGTVLFVKVYALSNRYGQYGMMKKIAVRGIPKKIRIKTRQVFIRLRNSENEK